jgi:hypothetical protein
MRVIKKRGQICCNLVDGRIATALVRLASRTVLNHAGTIPALETREQADTKQSLLACSKDVDTEEKV